MLWALWQFAPDLCLRNFCCVEAPLKYGGIYIDMDHVSKRRLARTPVTIMVTVDSSPEKWLTHHLDMNYHKFIDFLFPLLGLMNNRDYCNISFHISSRSDERFMVNQSLGSLLSSTWALQWEWPWQQGGDRIM